VLNPEDLQAGVIDLNGLNLNMMVIPPASNEQRRLELQIRGLSYVVLDTAADVQATKLCLQIFSLLNARNDQGAVIANAYDAFSLHSFAKDESSFQCFDFAKALTQPVTEYKSGLNGEVIFNFEQATDAFVNFSINDPLEVGLNFWYPFDQYFLNASFQVFYELRNGDTIVTSDVINPIITWEYQTSGMRLWNINLETEPRTWENPDPTSGLYEGGYLQVSASFWRPLLYRLAFPFFIVMLVFLIGLVPLLQTRDTLVDITAAMLFGIFGIKGIIGPSAEMGQTILDVALIMLYVLLAFSAMIFFGNKVLLRRKGRH
jgi:hypothetical protein